MALLTCSEDNYDPSSKTSFELKILNQYQSQYQEWLKYEIIFQLGADQYKFKSIEKEAITHTGMISEVGKFAFAISPHNEFEVLKEQLKKFLAEKDKKTFRFEPSDPSFEIIIERIKSLDNQEAFKFYCWVDAGNTKQLEYTWDGLGLRMVTNIAQLQDFANSL